MRSSMVLLAVVSLFGCESGLARVAQVTMPEDVAASFSETNRGVVVTDFGGSATPFVVLCGQALPKPLSLSEDLGFGCLGARKDTSETVRVWIQPLDAGVGDDAGVACSKSKEFYGAFSPTQPDGGSILVAAPEASFAKGEATGTWRRDLSPCGGVLSVEVTVAR